MWPMIRAIIVLGLSFLTLIVLGSALKQGLNGNPWLVVAALAFMAAIIVPGLRRG